MLLSSQRCSAGKACAMQVPSPPSSAGKGAGSANSSVSLQRLARPGLRSSELLSAKERLAIVQGLPQVLDARTAAPPSPRRALVKSKPCLLGRCCRHGQAAFVSALNLPL
jgi:hypothetical protein